MIVQASTVAEIQASPEFDSLAVGYAAEGHIDGMPPANPDWEKYRMLESLGVLHVFSATEDGKLVGYLSLIVDKHPRYSAPLAMTESWFVDRAARKTGAGLRLEKAAREKAREMGSTVLLVSAPVGGDLAELLPHLGYRATNLTFFKELVDA